MKNQCKKPQEYDVLWLSIISNTVFSDGRRGAHLISSDRKTEGFKAFCCCFGDEVFLLACFVGEFFLLTFLFPITYEDTTAEICGLQNMLINVISDRRFYFFYTSHICNDPDMQQLFSSTLNSKAKSFILSVS